ncbi:hypothetical protein CR513_14720, partial [Mucuna pruriens]
MLTPQSTLVEPTPHADSMSKSYPDVNFKAHFDSYLDADFKMDVDFKQNANSRLQLPSVWIHPSIKDRFHFGNFKHVYNCKLAHGGSSSSFNSISESNAFESKPDIADSQSYEMEQMEKNNRTLKELAIPDVLYQPLIHLLPKFHCLAGEDPYKHLKEFHVVCSMIRPQGIPKDYIKIKPVMFNTWGDMKRMFLEKFFSMSRTATIQKEICGIRQHSRETLYKYW